MVRTMGINHCAKTVVSTPLRTATAELRHLSLHIEVQAHLVQDPLSNQRVHNTEKVLEVISQKIQQSGPW